ncbi:ATP-binding protein [Tenacibaculum crassostreae]
MKKFTSKITSKSIEQSGLPSGYKAIAEYVWNGFDARATTIKIDYDSNEIGYLNSLSISDNGTGIDLSELENTFGKFQDSQKMFTFSKTGFIKGKKGKGRYSFTTFANEAKWDTVFEKEGKNFQYGIVISKEDSQNYGITQEKKVVKKDTGTVVTFDTFFDLYGDQLENEAFFDFLASEFGWFLHLNKERDYKIIVNGNRIDYNRIIADSQNFEATIIDDKFKVSYVRWSKKIGDKYFNYFLNSDKIEKHRVHTSFNNGAIDFHHSVYVESAYFNDFLPTKNDSPSFDKNQLDSTFKLLVSHLKEFISQKEKEYIKENKAEDLIIKYRNDNVFPSFKNTSYEQLRKNDLENVVKELYCAEPKIFHKLNKTQSRTLVGFLNLLLDSEERDKILTIIDGIVNLTDDERTELAETLNRTKFTHIMSLVKLLENRHIAVETLKVLVFDLEKFTDEINHIQKVIENNYWLFGEKYHLVSADVNFETVLNNYLQFLEINNNKQPKISELNRKEKLRRPDIFICRKSSIPDPNSNDDIIEENIIIELKRPSVTIGKEQYRQIEDYLNFIVNETQFNSQLRHWKFILVGKQVDGFIKGLYENQKNKGKRFLVQSINNYEIYAMTWDDLFRQYNHRHRNLVDKLEFKDSVIEELKLKGVNFDKKLSSNLTESIIN